MALDWVADYVGIGAALPTVAEGGSPSLMGIPRDEYIALCRLALSHLPEYTALLRSARGEEVPDGTT